MEDNLAYIDAWFNKTLSSEEVAQFEARVLEDKDFAADVAFYLASKRSLHQQVAEDKKELFRKLWMQNKSTEEGPKARVVRSIWVTVAAAAAVLVLGFFAWSVFFSNKESTVQMADKYINEKLTNLSVKMGADTERIQKGLRYFNSGQFDSSISQFEYALQEDTSNFTAKRYLGIVYLRLGNYDKSLLYFYQLENYSLFANPAKFYHALTLMKRNQPGDKKRAKELLEQVVSENDEGNVTARQWLDKW